MKTQKEIFLDTEADAWLARNRPALAGFDPTHDAVIRHLRPHLRPGDVVAEVGCALAGRAAALAHLTGGLGYGVDPSPQAIADASALPPHLTLVQSMAEALPWLDQSVDVLVYDFCLGLGDRADLFKIAAEGDRVLRDGGLLAVLDFAPPFPYRNPSSHQPGGFSYKMDHAALWTWNPVWWEISREICDHRARSAAGTSTIAPVERIAVSVLKKLPSCAYPLGSHHGAA